MAKMMDHIPEYRGEAILWQAIHDYLPDDVIAYHNREINGREFDVCLFLPARGILIIEVKGWQADKITVKGADEIHVEGYENAQRSPKKQARAYRFAMLNKIAGKYQVSPLVFDMVCYPFISSEDYRKSRLDLCCEEQFVLFKEDLESAAALNTKITSAYRTNQNIPHTAFSAQLMKQLRSDWEPVLPEKTAPNEAGRPYSLLSVWRDPMSDENRDQLINQYFSGIKSMIFLCHSEDYRKLTEAIDAEFERRNIEPGGNRLELGYRGELKKTEHVCRTFNLEIYYFDQIKELFSHNVLIREGRTDRESVALLEHLASITAFNLQQYLVEHAPVDHNTLVQAGAGTGKTFSMVSRVAFLCGKEEHPVTNIEEEIALATFTNDAANNMRIRLKQMFVNYFILTGDPRYLKFAEDTERAHISTIHKFALSILRELPLYTGLGTRFRISSDEKSRSDIYEHYLSTFLEAMEEENPNLPHEIPVPIYDLKRKLMGLANKLLDKSVAIGDIGQGELGVPTENSLPFFNELLEQVAFPAEIEYLSTLKDENKLNLQESIILLGKVLDKADRIQGLKLRYLFVDEFQDTDDSQIRMFQKIQKAVEQECRLFVVGDLKQSIYRFRGAKLDAFRQLQSASLFPWMSYHLGVNYRTDHRLLEQYDRIFCRMGAMNYLPYKPEEDRLVSSLTTGGSESGELIVIPCHGKEAGQFDETLLNVLDDQIRAVKELMLQTKLTQEERTIAILVRHNWQVREIVRIAKKAGIAVDTKSGGDLYQLESTRDLYKLALALENSANPVYLVNFIESNYTDLSLDYQKLHGADAKTHIKYLTEVLDQFFTKKMKKSWRQLIADVSEKPILYVLKQIYDALCPWRQYGKTTQEQLYYRENYEYLLECIIKYAKIDSLTLTGILHDLEINILTEQRHMSREMDNRDQNIQIQCITVHKSKGLEYGAVILPYTDAELGDLKRVKLDANYSKSKLSYSVTFDNLIKERNSNYIESQEIENQITDEARVLYVALTRAIRCCICIQNVDRTPDISWSTLLSCVSDGGMTARKTGKKDTPTASDDSLPTKVSEEKRTQAEIQPPQSPAGNRKIILGDDFGMNMRDTTWTGIWDNVLRIAEQTGEQEILRRFRDQADIFSEKEKPFFDCFFSVDNEEYDCALLWRDSKVMLFTEGSRAGFELARQSAWSCFIASDPEITPAKLAEQIKEK